MRRIHLASIVLVALVAAACGSETPTRSRAEKPPGRSEAPAVSGSVLPDVDVIEVTTEQRVNVASLVPSDRPLLLWFWAPH